MQHRRQHRGVRAPLWALICVVTVMVAWAPAPLQAADERASTQRSEEVRQLEAQMEELEAQLDAIYEKLDEYTINSAPQDILDERARIERQLQELHEQRTQAMRASRQAARDAPAARRSVDPPEPPREPQRRKPLANSIVRIGNNLSVAVDEIVNGDIILLGGNVRIEGEVLGDIVVLAGDLELARTASIGGQALVVGGYLDDAGATIEGGEPMGLSFFPARGGLRSGWSRSLTLFFDVFQFLLLFALASWFWWIHRRRMEEAHSYMQHNRTRSFCLGVLVLTAGSFVVSVAAMLLLVTFIGIPLACLLGILATVVLLAALFLGARQMGEPLLSRLKLPTGRWGATCVGLVIIVGPEVLGDVISGMSTWLEIGLDVLSGVLTVLALSSGLGALVMTRMGRAPEPEEDLGESPTLPMAVPG